jgi:hypothetical protein
MRRVRPPEVRRDMHQRIIELDNITHGLPLEKKARRKAARRIGRAFWFQGFKAAHPDATREDIATAWKEAQKEQTQFGMRALKMLEKSGFTITADAGAGDEDSDAADEAA